MLKIRHFCDRLVAVLQKVLDATTRIKKLLHASCDETKHLLNNWHIPDDSVCEELPDCICDDNNEGSKITEVAKNIQQVVEQAQRLRETLSVSQPQSKSSCLTQRSDTEKISQHLGLGSVKLNDKVQKKTEKAKVNSVKKPVATSNGSLTVMKGSVNNQSVAKGSSANNPSQTTLKNTKRQSTPFPIVNGNCDIKPITKPRMKSSPSFQTTYQKDFSVHTNCNVAKHNSAVSSTLKPKDSSVKDKNIAIVQYNNRNLLNVKNMENNPKKSSSTSLPGKAGISELEDLLCQVTAYPNISADLGIKKSKIDQMKVNSCLLHDDKTCHISDKAYRVTGLAEAVDVFGVPSDLVKVLKTYHCFLAESQEGMKHGRGAGKRQAAAKSFLSRLSTMVSYHRQTENSLYSLPETESTSLNSNKSFYLLLISLLLLKPFSSYTFAKIDIS
jgi:hypothetical protein